jgi:hypothetical protein
LLSQEFALKLVLFWNGFLNGSGSERLPPLHGAGIKIAQCLNLHKLGKDKDWLATAGKHAGAKEMIGREVRKRVWWDLVIQVRSQETDLSLLRKLHNITDTTILDLDRTGLIYLIEGLELSIGRNLTQISPLTFTMKTSVKVNF